MASNVTIGFDLGHDLDLEFSRSNIEFALSQPKVVRLPRNKKQTYRLNSRPHIWPMALTLAKTLTLEFSRSKLILTIWWPRSGVRVYQLMTGVTSNVGVPPTHLVLIMNLCSMVYGGKKFMNKSMNLEFCIVSNLWYSDIIWSNMCQPVCCNCNFTLKCVDYVYIVNVNEMKSYFWIEMFWQFGSTEILSLFIHKIILWNCKDCLWLCRIQGRFVLVLQDGNTPPNSPQFDPPWDTRQSACYKCGNYHIVFILALTIGLTPHS